jgi:hypothetical protein
MAYTWDDAKAEGKRVTQYFEMLGNRALITMAGWRPAGMATSPGRRWAGF